MLFRSPAYDYPFLWIHGHPMLSVHEVLIVPDNGEMEPKMLGEMVREVNKNEVERQEVLSDRVYSYDKEKHQIRQEPDSIQKVKEMER